MGEFEKGLQAVKIRKTAGLSKIYPEFVKGAGPTTKQQRLVNMFNSIFNSKKLDT